MSRCSLSTSPNFSFFESACLRMRGRLALGAAEFLLLEDESLGSWRVIVNSLGAWRVEEKARRRIGWRRRNEVEVDGQKSGLPDWRVNASITSRWHWFATKKTAKLGQVQDVDGTKKDKRRKAQHDARGREPLGPTASNLRMTVSRMRASRIKSVSIHRSTLDHSLRHSIPPAWASPS